MSKFNKAYDTLIKVEEDCKEAIQIAMKLKKGILNQSISDDQKRIMCDEIIKALER